MGSDISNQTQNVIPVSWQYKVTHVTRYRYEYPVSSARHLLHLKPRVLPWQHLYTHSLEIQPTFAQRLETLDAFGNPITHILIEAAHHELAVIANSEIETLPRTAIPDKSLPWEEARHRLSYLAQQRIDLETLDATRYAFESPLIRIKREFAAWASDCFSANCALHECILALNKKIHQQIVFDAKATEVSTTVAEVLANRRGVCQDFAHLMTACLRSLGLACRYMSGYLLTEPPKGQTRLIGADASHAWVAVYCPDFGWIELDPTNNCLADERHITLGWGRDFSDVSPLRGVITGGGEHEPEIEVTVWPLEDQSLRNR